MSPDRLRSAVVPEYTVRALDESTWPAFAALVENNNGIFGGCWCMGFHEDARGTEPPKRERKLARVRAGTAHAALVFDGDNCLGWCRFGVPDEVPRIKNRAAYEKGLTVLPDWRIACNFVGKGHRRQGVAAAGAQVRSTSSRISAAGGWRAIQRMQAPFLRAFSITVLSRLTKASDSSATARSASTAGSLRRWSSQTRSCPSGTRLQASFPNAGPGDSDSRGAYWLAAPTGSRRRLIRHRRSVGIARTARSRSGQTRRLSPQRHAESDERSEKEREAGEQGEKGYVRNEQEQVAGEHQDSADGRGPADPARVHTSGQDRRRERGEVQPEGQERREEEIVRQVARGVEGGQVRLLGPAGSISPTVRQLLHVRPSHHRRGSERPHEHEEGLAKAGPIPSGSFSEGARDDGERTNRQQHPDQVQQPVGGEESAVGDDPHRIARFAAPIGLEHCRDKLAERAGNGGNSSDAQDPVIARGGDINWSRFISWTTVPAT